MSGSRGRRLRDRVSVLLSEKKREILYKAFPRDVLIRYPEGNPGEFELFHLTAAGSKLHTPYFRSTESREYTSEIISSATPSRAGALHLSSDGMFIGLVGLGMLSIPAFLLSIYAGIVVMILFGILAVIGLRAALVGRDGGRDETEWAPRYLTAKVSCQADDLIEVYTDLRENYLTDAAGDFLGDAEEEIAGDLERQIASVLLRDDDLEINDYLLTLRRIRREFIQEHLRRRREDLPSDSVASAGVIREAIRALWSTPRHRALGA